MKYFIVLCACLFAFTYVQALQSNETLVEENSNMGCGDDGCCEGDECRRK